jgi:hypothetical protein
MENSAELSVSGTHKGTWDIVELKELTSILVNTSKDERESSLAGWKNIAEKTDARSAMQRIMDPKNATDLAIGAEYIESDQLVYDYNATDLTDENHVKSVLAEGFDKSAVLRDNIVKHFYLDIPNEIEETERIPLLGKRQTLLDSFEGLRRRYGDRVRPILRQLQINRGRYEKLQEVESQYGFISDDTNEEVELFNLGKAISNISDNDKHLSKQGNLQKWKIAVVNFERKLLAIRDRFGAGFKFKPLSTS